MKLYVKIFAPLPCLLAATLLAQTPATQPRTGSFNITFTERSPHSAIQTQAKRHHIKVEDRQQYELSGESFEVVVPETFDGERPFGLMVWVSPMASGRAPQMWLGTLEKHNLIWIGANNSGNERGVGVRFGLALDAVHNLQQLYKIDDSRIYVAGFSGGGKCASMLGMIYPEVFDGAIAMGGVGFYRTIPVPEKKGMVYPNTFDRPPTKMYDLARTRGRMVLLIGDQDFNYVPVKTTYEEGFNKDGFEHVTLLEVPGLEHRLADESWLEKSIFALDEPLADQSKDLLAQAEDLEKQGKFAEAYGLYLRVSMHGGQALGEKADSRMADLYDKARLELVKARRAAEQEQYSQAADLLLKLRQTYGGATPPEAEDLLRQLEANAPAAQQIKAERDRQAAAQREALATTALETARMLQERDLKRAYEALRKVAADFPDTTAAANATAEADKLWSDPKLRARIQTDPDEVEAQKLLSLAENYRRNHLYSKARERIDKLLQTYPNTKAAVEAKKLLQRIKEEERAAGTR
jgi:hypothetical protein